MGVDFPDSGREWMSRYRAVCTTYSIYWIGLMSAAIYGPLLIFRAAPYISVPVTFAWAGTTVSSFLAGSSSKTGKGKDEKPTISWWQALAKVGPPIFVAGLLILIATVEHVLLAHFGAGLSLTAISNNYWHSLDPRPLSSGQNWIGLELKVLLGLAGAGLLLAWRVDINEFSMHHFYKNRLVRCYLGASHQKRSANPFTGFDEADDLPLSRLKASKRPDGPDGREEKNIAEPDTEIPYEGPYPLINATLNLATGKQLAFQERKAASFLFSPCFLRV